LNAWPAADNMPLHLAGTNDGATAANRGGFPESLTAFLYALTALFATLWSDCLPAFAESANFRAVYSFQDNKDGRNPQWACLPTLLRTTFLGGDPHVLAEQSSRCFPLAP